jgi:YVTN family beta-propeller protein
VLDPATDKIVAQIATGASPHFVKLFPGTTLGMVVVQGPGQVLFFDPATNQPVKTVTVGKQPHWMGLSADAKTAYVTNEGDGTISVIDLASGTTTSIPVGKAPRKVVAQQTTQQAPVAAATVSIANFAFGPASVTVHVGEAVTWTNNDGATHTVTFKDSSTGTDSLPPGRSFTRTFDHAGTFNYFCSFHPYMTGTIVVAP